MDVSPFDKDFMVRTRSVLWREIPRVGGTKELARAHVNIPSEAVKALELDSKGDTVAFIIRNDSNNVILTNLFESQRSITSWEKDPQVMLEYLLSKVIVLKSEKSNVYERWENGEIDNAQFTKISQGIRERLNDLTKELKKIQDTYFRGSSDSTTSVFIDEKTRSEYSTYASGILDYNEELVSKIASTKKYLGALESALSKGLISESEYHEEKEQQTSLLEFLMETLSKAIKILANAGD